MMLKILAALALVLVAILVIAATRPDSLRIQRSIAIHAPAQKVFSLVNDFHQWTAWAPQDKEDLSMRRSYRGPASGVGAVSDWDSSGTVGKGSMTIQQSESPALIVVEADWKKPFVTRNLNRFEFQQRGSLTELTWTMEGQNLFPMKVMSLFVSMDKMMGRHFESGLANLKKLAEQ